MALQVGRLAASLALVVSPAVPVASLAVVPQAASLAQERRMAQALKKLIKHVPPQLTIAFFPSMIVPCSRVLSK
jgi:hypothetical protein